MNTQDTSEPVASLIADFLREETPVVFEKGETLIAGNTFNTPCYVILEGSVDICRGGNTVATEGPGNIVGEFSLVDEGPASADVVANTATKAVPITQEQFDSLIQEHPEFAREVSRVMSDRTRQRNQES